MEDAELRELVQGSARELRQELRQAIEDSANGLRQELRQAINESASELRQAIDDSAENTRDELTRHFGVVADSLRHDIQLLAEAVDTKAGKSELAEFRAEVRAEFAQVHTSIRALDHRLAAVET